jgi:hypothetical protein
MTKQSILRKSKIAVVALVIFHLLMFACIWFFASK